MNRPGSVSKTMTPSSAAIAAVKSGRATSSNSRPSRLLEARYSVISARTSTSSTTAAITIAASVATGRFSNSPVRASNVTIVSAATIRPESWVREIGRAHV
jgi:hypothetical protein